MKPKTRKFVDTVAENPKMSHTDAYLATHKTENRTTATTNAYKLLQKPSVLEYMATKSDYAERTVYGVLKNARKRKDDVQWQRLAKDSANDILDRVHGKPLTKTTNLNIGATLEEALNSLQ